MMPLPDESRPGRASDLIRRFQAAVDSHGEQPLAVSSSFASPGKPRTSTGVIGKPRESLGAAVNGAGNGELLRKALSPTCVPAVAEPKAREGGTVFRSAGLSEKPTVPIEEQGRKNAAEAFPDMQPAPKVTLAKDKPAVPEPEVQQGSEKADEPEAKGHADNARTKTEDAPPPRKTSPIPPPPVVTLDVPPPEPVPGSTDAITGDVAIGAPEPVETLSPSTPSRSPSPHATREGLSRPTSPAADDRALRVPPTQDDNSPPPTPPRVASPPATPDGPATTEPVPLSAADPSPSPSPASSPNLSRTRSRPSRSPTQTRQQPTIPLPSTGRGLTTPTASSLAKARTRVPSTSGSGSGSTSPSAGRARTPGASPEMPRSARMSPAASREGARSARKSPAASGDGAIAAGDAGMARARSAGTTTPRKSATTPIKRAPRSGGADAGPGSPSPASASSTSALRIRGGAAPVGKVARRGRIGLAGARAGRPASAGAGEGQAEGPSGKEEGKESVATRTENKTEDIPVFQGFGAARPHGRIPIPMQEPGEGGEKRAVMADEVERAGQEAKQETAKEVEGGPERWWTSTSISRLDAHATL